MRILIGCDVDPILPPVLRRPADTGVWNSLGQIRDLVATMGDSLPPMTWLIRSDESIRFSTGAYESGYTCHRDLWRALLDRGHELGWHAHHLSYDRRAGAFGFDPEPSWLAAAHGSLAEHFAVRATRVGWDYGSTASMNSLSDLGVELDFSALPGSVAWHQAGFDRVRVDWLDCPRNPYHPDRNNYQRSGPDPLHLLEVPIACFPNPMFGVARRMMWRFRNGCWSMRGLHTKTLLMTDPWPSSPAACGDICALFFHPEDLTGIGITHFVRNLDRLLKMARPEFVTASQIRREPG